MKKPESEVCTRDDGRWQKRYTRDDERKNPERECVYSIPGVMEAPAAIYILSAISTSDMFSTSSVKACTSSNDIPSCTMMVEICTHTIEYANLYQYVNVLKQHCE